MHGRRLTGRDEDQIALTEAYAKAQGFWRAADAAEPVFTDTLTLDMANVVPSLAGIDPNRCLPIAGTSGWPRGGEPARLSSER